MLGFLAKVAAVLASGAPVFALLLGLTATAVTLWGTFIGAITVSTQVASQLARCFNAVSSFFVSTNEPLVFWFIDSFSIKTLLSYFGVSLAVVSGVVSALSGVFLAALGVIVTIWLYRKARMFANIVTGTGVTE